MHHTSFTNILAALKKANLAGSPVLRAACAKSADSWIPYGYAAWVIEGRFPEGEASISKDRRVATYYCQFCLKLNANDSDIWMIHHNVPTQLR